MITDPTNLHLPEDPDLGVVVNLPPALTGRGVNGLPPYARTRGYQVDRYPACPESWPRGQSSYFVPVNDGRGMWLDFNQTRNHKHHVAIVVSIQGINPLTGRKTDKLELERYADDPTVEPWLRGYQNYLSSVASPPGMLWIDGFKSGTTGEVRQYVFTKDESSGVAAQLIGVDRVFSIGVAYFTSKEPKPPQPKDPTVVINSHLASYYPYWYWSGSGLKYNGLQVGYLAPPNITLLPYNAQDSAMTNTCYTAAIGQSKSVENYSSKKLSKSGGSLLRSSGLMAGNKSARIMPQSASVESYQKTTTVVDSSVMADCSIQSVQEERLELAAGERIQQTLYKDHTERGFWHDRPAGTVIINYAPQQVVDKIIAGGEGPAQEGFLRGLKTGVKAVEA